MNTVNREKDRHPSFGLIGWGRIHAAGLEKLLEDENPLVSFAPGDSEDD